MLLMNGCILALVVAEMRQHRQAVFRSLPPLATLADNAALSDINF